MLTGIKNITIPEGPVKQLASSGVVLWQAQAESGSIVPGLNIDYTGDYTDQKDVVMSNGQTYRLLTLTGSGTLTLEQTIKADIWLCAGGNGGRNGGYHGGGGGKFVQSDGVDLALSTVCTIGAGASGTSTSSGGVGGSTTFGTLQAVQTTGSYKAASGASGGGAGGRGTYTNSSAKAGTGAGVSTVPFLDATIFDPHSAGGGGGAYEDETSDTYVGGGAGGSDGADGGVRKAASYKGGAGGEKGGGAGGKPSSLTNDRKGGAATFYGSGGGGGGYLMDSSENIYTGPGGAGYQGVIYVRIPYDQ